MRSARSLGNGLSPFASLATLQRRAAGRWAGHYDAGAPPLLALLPLDPAPWVFTFNSWSPAYEPLVRAAVRSALAAGGVAPHCLFAGDAEGAPIARWMRARGVRVHPVDPEWRAALMSALARRAPHPDFARDEGAVVSAWQRLDLPLAPGVDQHTYALYTDADVVFLRPFALHDLPRPLPLSVGLGPESRNVLPYSVGVAVANVPALAATRRALIDFVLGDEAVSTNRVRASCCSDLLDTPTNLSHTQTRVCAIQSHNLHTHVAPLFHPPPDTRNKIELNNQDAYNRFYEADVKAWRLPARLNAKAYHRAAPRRLGDVAVAHFHGPKPLDYLRYGARLAPCPARHGDLCEKGLGARACPYLRAWVRFADDGGEEGGGGGGEGSPTRAELEAMLRKACGDDEEGGVVGQGKEGGVGGGEGGAPAPAA